MAKGLFLIFPAHGHINPTIGLVRELIDKGDEITYISANEFKDKIEKVGATFKGYDQDFSINPNNTNILCSMLEQIMNMNKDIVGIALKEETNYDYLVCDPIIFAGEKLKKKLNIKKTISTLTTFAMCDEIVKYFVQAKNEEDKQEFLAFFEKMKPEMAKLKEDYGIELPNSMEEIILGYNVDLNLVFTSKYYQPYTNKFDDKKFAFVGPSIFDRKELENFKIDNPDNKKVVFISLGTVANQNLKFYKDCLKALGSRDDLIVVMSIGKRIDIKELGDIPSNFRIYSYVPQLEVLKQIELFITHGGMNSSSEGLYNGLPLIVVPQFADQFLIAERVTELGAGLPLINDVNPSSIEKTVNEVLSNPSYRENAKKIGESLKMSGGYKKAAECIHELLN